MGFKIWCQVRGEGPNFHLMDGLDGWTNGWDGRSLKVSFKFLLTLWAFSTYITPPTFVWVSIWCQVGVWGTQFSKLHYVREFLNIWFQKLTDIRCKSMGFKIWCQVGGEGQNFQIYFRLGTYNVPEGPSANPYGEARSAEFDGRVDGLDGPDLCPLNFFILCGYID